MKRPGVVVVSTYGRTLKPPSKGMARRFKNASSPSWGQARVPIFRHTNRDRQHRQTGDRQRGIELHHRKHGLPQRFAVRQLGISGECSECSGHQRNSAVSLHFPVRDHERAPAGVKKARARPDSASAPGLSPAAVLQADSTSYTRFVWIMPRTFCIAGRRCEQASL